MVVTVLDLINILAAPTEVFHHIKQKPRWFWAFCLIALVFTAVGFFTTPFGRQITAQMLSQTMQKDQVDHVLAISARFQYVGLAAVPLVLLVKWLLVTALLYFSAIVLDATDVPFKALFACVVYSEMILALMGVTNILLLYIKGVDNVRQILDLQAVIGCDYFLHDKSSSLPLFTFLNSINVFNLWYVATLGIGVSVMTSISKFKSTVLVGLIWLLGVGFQIATIAVSSGFPPPATGF